MTNTADFLLEDVNRRKPRTSTQTNNDDDDADVTAIMTSTADDTIMSSSSSSSNCIKRNADDSLRSKFPLKKRKVEPSNESSDDELLMSSSNASFLPANISSSSSSVEKYVNNSSSINSINDEKFSPTEYCESVKREEDDAISVHTSKASPPDTDLPESAPGIETAPSPVFKQSYKGFAQIPMENIIAGVRSDDRYNGSSVVSGFKPISLVEARSTTTPHQRSSYNKQMYLALKANINADDSLFAGGSTRHENDSSTAGVISNKYMIVPDLLSVHIRWIRRAYCYITFQERIANEGRSFRSELRRQPRAVENFKLARFIFHASSVVTPLLYYAKAGTVVDTPPKFPATISYTIRKGLPKQVHFLMCIAGWAAMFPVLRRCSTPWVQCFFAQMLLLGLWATQIFPLNNNNGLVPEFVNDVCHFFGAVAYLVYQVVAMRLINIQPLYRRLFFSSFGLLTYSLFRVKQIERMTGIVMESGTLSSPQERELILSTMSPELRQSLFQWELMVMVFENLLFASFVQGFPSGLLLQDDGQDDRKNGDIKLR